MKSSRLSTDPQRSGRSCETAQAAVPAGHEEFICEELVPVAGTGDASAMARGEPGLPGRFTWRGVEYRVAGVVRQWKTSSPCRNGSAEMYLRRHWYQIITEPQAVMTVYCDRQAKDRKNPRRRWWVYSVGGEGVSPLRVRSCPGRM